MMNHGLVARGGEENDATENVTASASACSLDESAEACNKGHAVGGPSENEIGQSASNFVHEAFSRPVQGHLTLPSNNFDEHNAADVYGQWPPARIAEYDVSEGIVLGRGAFSHVYQGVNTRTAERVAIKAIKLTSENPEGYHSEYKINRILRNHPNVVELLDHVSPTNGVGYLVFELCPLGELFQHILPNTGLSPRARIGTYFAQLVGAVCHVHNCGVCHLDIKPENLFLDGSGNLKLGDFGLSTLAEDGSVNGCRGSYGYAAPENIRSKRSRRMADDVCSAPRVGYHGQLADVWSMGIVLFVFLYGYTPWEAATDSSVEFRMFKMYDGCANMKPWNRMPTALRSLFQRTLSVRPARRWAAIELQAYVSRHLGWSP